MKLNWEFTDKQLLAIHYLEDDKHTEIFYGGGAGGGKSRLGCSWLIKNCIKYSGSRWLMGRAHLKDLKASTLLTFFEVCKDSGLIKDIHYKYNQMDGIITWYNGSTVFLKDLFAYPSDPEFDSLGSTEYTGGFIDEISEITIKAKMIVMSRIRFKLDEFGIIPKLLMASNPSKNFAYYEFYRPSKDGTLASYRIFLPALATDNPFISKHYIENLKKLDKNSKERLLYGNFEYDDDPTKLFHYDSIIDLFTSGAKRGEIYVIVDAAGFGRDKCMISFWDGWFVEDIEMRENISSKELDELLLVNGVPRSHCLVDEIGVGFGLIKDLPGIKGFVSNARPFKTKREAKETKQNYKNLKAQCWFELADAVNAGKIGITRDLNIKIKSLLIEDLEQMKHKNPEKDAPLEVSSKDDLKEMLGRSTDVGDALMMRMFFELRPRVVTI